MELTEPQRQVLRYSEHFRSLLEHPGFKLLVEEAKKAVCSQWTGLLTVSPDDLKHVQGFIEGANFVLEYADVQVVQAEAIRHREEENRASAIQTVLQSQAALRARTRRGMVPGADLGS